MIRKLFVYILTMPAAGVLSCSGSGNVVTLEPPPDPALPIATERTQEPTQRGDIRRQGGGIAAEEEFFDPWIGERCALPVPVTAGQ